jgi:hypothetical protein
MFLDALLCKRRFCVCSFTIIRFEERGDIDHLPSFEKTVHHVLDKRYQQRYAEYGSGQVRGCEKFVWSFCILQNL